MSPLRQRMIEDMTLAGLAAGTQERYIRAGRRLAAHYRRSPEQLSAVYEVCIDPNNTAGHPETAVFHGDAAVVPVGTPQPSRNYPPRRRAPKVKYP